jgi:hypothetical protein
MKMNGAIQKNQVVPDNKRMKGHGDHMHSTNPVMAKDKPHNPAVGYAQGGMVSCGCTNAGGGKPYSITSTNPKMNASAGELK